MEIMRQKVSLRFLLLIVTALVTLNVCADSNLLPGKFKVNSSGKQVQFTKSNLYWNGSAFKFESSQTSYPTQWNANHVSHLFWSTKASSSYSSLFPYMEWQSVATTDVPFFAESKKITVEGTSGLFVLKDTEWSYLISSRSNASNLRKYGVKVGNVENCLIIAPDDFSGTLKSSYTLSELNSLGLVCLPPAGYRADIKLAIFDTGGYWTATPHSSNEQQAKLLSFTEYSVGAKGSNYRNRGFFVRLVKLAPVSITSVTLNNSSVTLRPSETFPLTVTVAPSNAANKNVTWSTSNSSVAKVSNTGLVTAVAAGNCVITCTAADGSGKKATCSVIVHGGPSGVEAVDLGLPSGTLWANMNVGATSPEKYGGYYAWGEITIKNNFVWSTYKYGNSATSLSKYCVDSKYGTVDNIKELEESDDAASINWSSDWTMPTYSQMKEIFSVCKMTWITMNGISGYQVVGPNGNSIFLPAGSYYDGTTLHYAVGTHGDYWTKTVGSDNTCAFGVGFSSTQINVTALDPARLRYQGRNIRPVSISKAIRVTSIEIAPAILEMNYGESKEVNYTIIPEDATDKEVTWSTSNSLIATVSSSGVVTAVGEGTCTITCTSATNTSVKATCQVIVYDIPAGLELVDLGLPSGTLWANMNVGAKKPEEYGGYYAWGETATKDEYSWEGYKLCDGAYNKLIKYNSDVTLGEIDNLTVLEPEDDAAYMTWGKFCHMPTKEESEELVSYCEMTPITVNDISGWRFVGRNGNEIFVPNGGYVTTTVSDGSHESHWTNLGDAFYLQTSGLGEKSNMNYLVTSSDGNCPIVNWETHNRKDGRNVRPVGTNKAIRVTEIRVTPAQIDLFFGGTAQLIAAVLPENATNQAVTWSTSDEQIAKITSEGLVTATGKGTAIITCTALDGSGVSGTMTVTVINEMVINDGEPLDFSDAVLDKLTYNRTMKNKEWQPLYVPFSMSYDDWKNYYDVAQINMMHQYDNDNDGEPDEMELEFFLVTKGALKPNYPYIIRLKNADDPDVEVSSSNPQNVSLVIEDCSVEATKENTVYCMSMFYEYFFTGTYEGVTNKSGYYAMSSGKLIRASETANLKPQRWYMTIFNRESQLIQPVEHVKVHVFGDTETIEDEATTIDYIESTNAPVHVYDLQGRKVKQHTRPGIYIMNNKKVLVR